MKTNSKTQIQKQTKKYSYKVWWFNYITQMQELTSYSRSFDTLKKAEEWYQNYGLKLEKRFNRKLVLKIS